MQETLQDLQKVYSDFCLTYTCVRKWFRRFCDGRESAEDDGRKTLPCKVKTTELISAVETCVMEDRRITVRNVAETFDITYGTAQDIMTNDSGMRRVCARWVPRLLLPDQLRGRVHICQDLLDMFEEEGDQFLNNIVTCDETWVHFFELESKQQSSVWKHPTSPSPIKARLSKSVGKLCLSFSVIFGEKLSIIIYGTKQNNSQW